MNYYAQLKNNIAVSVSEITENKIDSNFIPLDSLDISVLGKTWNGTSFELLPEQNITQDALLDELDLIYLCQEYGGMTDDMLVEVYENPLLKAFVIKLKASRNILPTDPRTIAGLSALEALNYLPNGKESVLDNWPKI